MAFRFLRLGTIAFFGATACTGNVVGPGEATPTGGVGNPGTASGGTIGGGAGAGVVGTGGSPAGGGTGGTPGGGPSGTGGDPGTTPMPTTPAKLNLSGSPSYLRFVRLTNGVPSATLRRQTPT